MAGGWAWDETVQEQIEDSVAGAVMLARMSTTVGEGETHCFECGEPIPDRRQATLPGARTCVVCQSTRDARPQASLLDRRGSEDSQLH